MHATRRRISLLLVVLLASVVTVLPPAGNAAAAPVFYNGAGSAPRIGIIGDSTIAALRWTNTWGPLRRFNYTYDAESCRRTATPSCRGREGYQPDTVIGAMRRLSGQWGSLLVIMGGYDDPGFGFASAIDAVMAEAARQGIPAVMWLTLRTADVSYVGPTYRSNSTTFRDNNRILLQKAGQYGSRLQIADWATYSASRPDWFYSDGIHMRPSGALAAATYIANQAERVLGVINSGWTDLRVHSSGRAVADAQQALIDAGIFVRDGVTGTFDIWTFYAVKTFQRRNGLPVTGVIDAATARKLSLLGGAWTTLRVGSSGGLVRRVQQALIDRGIFVRGGATGTFDVWTLYAVQTFQRWQGLARTGVVDAETARRLGLHLVPAPDSVWKAPRMSASGLNVAKAQRALMDHGIFVRGGVTGTFDIWTFYAVNTFQRRNGLPVTGVVDAATARALGLFERANPVGGWEDLRLGSVGGLVQGAQQALTSRGIVVRGGATGVFNIATFYAVQTFQRYNGLRVTGIVDLATADALGLLDPVAATALAAAAPTTMSIVTTTPPTNTTTTTTSTTSTTTSTTSTTVDSTTTTAVPAAPDLIEDLVWLDTDGDGRQAEQSSQSAEPGVAGITVRLLDGNGVPVAVTLTDHDGAFRFGGSAGGTYRVEIELPAGITITSPDVGPDDEIDSDATEVDDVALTARTDWITVPGGNSGVGVDIGLVPLPPAPESSTTTSVTATTTTVLPTTEPPATEPPATVPPSSGPTSSTQPPDTAAPTTEAPETTVPPATEPPATEPPTSTTIG